MSFENETLPEIEQKNKETEKQERRALIEKHLDGTRDSEGNAVDASEVLTNGKFIKDAERGWRTKDGTGLDNVLQGMVVLEEGDRETGEKISQLRRKILREVFNIKGLHPTDELSDMSDDQFKKMIEMVVESDLPLREKTWAERLDEERERQAE